MPGGKWTETVLHRFSSTSDGSEPYAGVVFDTSGLLYGTTKIGGANGMGVVFQMFNRGSENRFRAAT